MNRPIRKFNLKSISAPEWFAIIAILTGGLVIVFMTPVSAGYDEETHLARVWEMSSFQFIPNASLGNQQPFPAIYYQLSYRRQKMVEPVTPEFLTHIASKPIDANDYIYGDFQTRSVYSPPLLFPQAMTMRYLGRSLHLPALTVFYACRAAGLLSYLILAWLAIRTIPFGKWVLAVLIAAPMTLFQAATISTDAITNGIAFLFVGGSLGIASRSQIDWKRWWVLVVLFFMLFWGKVNLVFLAPLPFILIPASKFKMKAGYALLLFAAILLLVIEVGGWNLLAYTSYLGSLKSTEGLSASGQTAFILHHPFTFIKILFDNFIASTGEYLRGWLALYGYDYWPVPSLTIILYPLAILAALLYKYDDQLPDLKTRITLFGLFILGCIGTVSSLYLSFTPVGSPFILGVQGRYFIPIMPLLFLALTGLAALERFRKLGAWIGSFTSAGLLIYLVGLVLSYHVVCGSEYYRTGLCYLPNYKNWAPDQRYSPPISNQVTLKQEILPRCNDLTSIRVWVNSSGSAINAVTEFIVKANDNQVTAQRTISDHELPDGNWFALNFAPDPSSLGKLYTLTIQSDDPASVNSLKVSYSLKPEYTDGKLYENGQAVPQDMIFQYGCAAGLQKLWQDFNTRIN